MTYIGIDPGKSGAMAVIYNDGRLSLIPFGEDAYIQQLQEIEAPAFCVLERVGAMPGQGVTSMFHFGENFGFAQGVLKTIGIPFELVTPQRWKKAFGVTQDKNSSIEVCKRMFPGVELKRTARCRKEDDGIAEALLMAEYGRRIHGAD